MDERRLAAEGICLALAEAGHRALLAGGCVRDMLLGVESKDYDIATDAAPGRVAELFPRHVDVGAAFGVMAVLLPEGAFEVATFRRDGPYLDGRHPSYVEHADERQDALRRDFTANALFYDPLDKTVIDYVGGREDIQAKRIRAVGEARKRFEEDYLRLLRAVRFAARLDYTIEPDTWDALCAFAPSILQTSPERIRDELLKMLTEGAAERAFRLLDASGLLDAVLPEVAAMKGVEQPPEFHPEGDVFTHTLMMLGLMRNPSPTLALGVLLHDIGKPPTQTFEDRIRFNYHDKVGAEMAWEICRRLRMSNEETERVCALVGGHMRLATTPDMRESRRKRFMREDYFPELLELCRLDALASHGRLDTIEWIEDYLTRTEPAQLRPEPLLTGHGLIAMGYAPGPLFGKILHTLEDAQLEGITRTPEEARELVARNWPRKG